MPSKYAFLKAEVKSPYRGLRRFFYIAFAGSGAVGGLIALLRLIAQRGDSVSNWQNLAIQISVTALMVWLWQKDKPSA